MLDAKLAALYGVPTKALAQAVKRNALRFPDDFMFQLARAESMALRSRSVTSKSRVGRGGRRYRPYAFTEQGVAMLSSVLRSERAIQVNIVIVRTFVRLRRMLASQPDLERKVDALERKYDGQFKVVFDAIRELPQGIFFGMGHPPPKRGLHVVLKKNDGQRRVAGKREAVEVVGLALIPACGLDEVDDALDLTGGRVAREDAKQVA